ncbi:MAG TPA: hypothetical protein VF519_11080 [Mycobacteriales bacterium]|jgi:hypothetical protein
MTTEGTAGTPAARTARGARRRPYRLLVLVLAVGVLAAGVLVAVRRGADPPTRARRRLASVELPRELTRDGEAVGDFSRACVEPCPALYRFYVTPLPPRRAAELVGGALRGAGFETRFDDECPPGWCVLHGPTLADSGVPSWEIVLEDGDYVARVTAGLRADGSTGVQLLAYPGD